MYVYVHSLILSCRYDASAHREVIEEHRKIEEVKRELKKEKLAAGLGNPEVEDDGAPSSGDEDEDKYVDKMDMPGTKVDAAERYTVSRGSVLGETSTSFMSSKRR